MKDQEVDEKLIAAVRSRVKQRPHMAAKIIGAVTAGVDSAVAEANERAADMETLASVALAMAESKGRVTSKTREYFEGLAQSKIEKYYPKTYVPWDHYFPGEKEGDCP